MDEKKLHKVVIIHDDHTYITEDYTSLCLNIICNQYFFYMRSALYHFEFSQGWKDLGTKTYLYTACANCYLRFWGKVIFKTGNILSTTWLWLNTLVQFYAINQHLTWSLIFYEKYSTSQSDLWFRNFHWPDKKFTGHGPSDHR
jgi:hypothetical protein